MLAAVARYGTSLLADEHERSAFNWITNSTGNLTVWCSEPDDNVPLHGLDTPCPERLDAFKMTCNWAKVFVQYDTHETSFGFDSEAQFREQVASIPAPASGVSVPFRIPFRSVPIPRRAI